MQRLTTTLTATLVALALPFVAAAQHDHGAHATPPRATASAGQSDHVFASYEEARLAMIKGSLPELKKAAKHLGVSAHSADQHALSELAAELGSAMDLKAARLAFAAVSQEVIKYRETRCCDRPVVVYCSMEKKSWLQPAGEIGNPYVGASMRKCGEITKD